MYMYVAWFEKARNILTRLVVKAEQVQQPGEQAAGLCVAEPYALYVAVGRVVQPHGGIPAHAHHVRHLLLLLLLLLHHKLLLVLAVAVLSPRHPGLGALLPQAQRSAEGGLRAVGVAVVEVLQECAFQTPYLSLVMGLVKSVWAQGGEVIVMQIDEYKWRTCRTWTSNKQYMWPSDDLRLRRLVST